MNKYVNIEVAKEYLRHDSFSNPYFRSQACQQAMNVLDTVPIADVVEVVRCGQCKYWKQRDNREYGLCIKHRGIWLNSDFCSKGEHKDGGQDA